MAVVVYTASSGSGYITSPMFDVALGPFRLFTAHYSAPTAGSGVVDPGITNIRYVHIQNMDDSKYTYGTNSAGGQTVYFSGHALGATGYMLIFGD